MAIRNKIITPKQEIKLYKNDSGVFYLELEEVAFYLHPNQPVNIVRKNKSDKIIVIDLDNRKSITNNQKNKDSKKDYQSKIVIN